MGPRFNLRLGLVPVLLATLLLGGLTSSVAARENAAPSPSPPSGSDTDVAATPVFAIFPKETGPMTFFDVEQEAGTSQDYTVVLVNAGDEKRGAFTGRTFAVDVRTKVNGGLETGSPDDLKTGATTWLNYPNDVLTLQPGKGVERTFTVSVPEKAPPGQYVAALCFETAEPLAIAGEPNLKQNLRQTIAFYLTVPGETHPEFSIQNVHITTDPSWSGIEAEVANTGNVLVRPEGRVTVSRLDGTPVVTTEIAFGAFYAGQVGRIQTGFGDSLPPGEYLVTIELRDPDTGATAILQNQRVETTTFADRAAAEASSVGFTGVSAELKPSAGDPQFLNLAATISNHGDLVSDAQLSLQVTRNGNLVENYVVVSPLSLPNGETSVSNRYIPIDGWTSGTWSFSLSVQVLDRATGVAQVLTTISLGDPIVIP